MSCSIDQSTIVLTGSIGQDLLFGTDDFFSLGDVRSALASVAGRKNVTVRLNSGGGVSSDGVAIASLLSGHPGGTTVIIEGVAAAAAAVAACGAKRVVMSAGAVFAISGAEAFTMGTADQHRSVVDELRATNLGYANVLARKTGRSVQEMLALIEAETWLDPAAAVAAGFADAIEGDVPTSPAPYAYARYRHAPATMLAAQAAPQSRAKPQPEPTPKREPTMPTIEQTDLRAISLRSALAAAGVTEEQANKARDAAGRSPLPKLPAPVVSDARARSRASMLAEIKRQGLVKDDEAANASVSTDPRAVSMASMKSILRQQGVEPVSRHG